MASGHRDHGPCCSALFTKLAGLADLRNSLTALEDLRSSDEKVLVAKQRSGCVSSTASAVQNPLGCSTSAGGLCVREGA